MRREVTQLMKLGPLPRSSSDVQKIEQWQSALEKIEPPITDDEAAELISLFPPEDDECYGLAWTLVHLVETAPNWPLRDSLLDKGNPWIARLRQAAQLG